MGMKSRKSWNALRIAIVLFLVLGGVRAASAQVSPAVGLLRVSGIDYPRQVAPSASFAAVIDVQYATQTNATIKANLYEGSVNATGSKLWESQPTLITGGGDQIWTVNLTAPSQEENWSLTVFAFYLDSGVWNYYNDSYHGPGYYEMTLKVAPNAELDVDLNAPGIQVAVNSSSQTTSATGEAMMQLPVGQDYRITVPTTVQFENSTRLTFVGWQDGINNSQRTIKLVGDSKLVGEYKTQYLLQVNSAAPGYGNSTWHDAESTVTLTVSNTVPFGGPLQSIGLVYTFKGWTGAVQSTATQINVTMNGPQVVTANFSVDYTPLMIPAIIILALLGSLLLSLAKRRRAPAQTLRIEEEASADKTAEKACENCGKPVEREWTHCIYCGKSLSPPEPVQS